MDLSMDPVLVIFDTKNGSTAEVAQAIARRLGERGAAVELRSARSAPDLVGWAGIVVGAPIYSGRWMNGAHRTLKKLARIAPEHRPPVAIFALGPRQDEGPEDWLGPRQQFERALSKHRSIVPISTALFGGADPPKKKVRRDIRDWDAISEWADKLAGLFGCT
jgi:menaquinone-dependent protoporphyrinogen oxidase